MGCRGGEFGVVGYTEDSFNADGEVVSIAVAGQVAIDLMVDQIAVAADVEPCPPGRKYSP